MGEWIKPFSALVDRASIDGQLKATFSLDIRSGASAPLYEPTREAAILWEPLKLSCSPPLALIYTEINISLTKVTGEKCCYLVIMHGKERKACQRAQTHQCHTRTEELMWRSDFFSINNGFPAKKRLLACLSSLISDASLSVSSTCARSHSVSCTGWPRELCHQLLTRTAYFASHRVTEARVSLKLSMVRKGKHSLKHMVISSSRWHCHFVSNDNSPFAHMIRQQIVK